MNTLAIELRKEKRTGVVAVLLIVGILGAAYEFANFIIRKDTLLSLPMSPMDILLTQLYGVIMILNMFGIVVATCMMYSMEFKGAAIKKMYTLPVSISCLYLCKFLILTIVLFVAIAMQNLALMKIGISDLPRESFSIGMLIAFAGYSFLTSMPVLSLMLFVSSRFETMWIPLGVGVAGFLSSMALGTSNISVFLINPFVIMIKPAVSMNARPDLSIVLIALIETFLLLGFGLWMSKNVHYE